MEDTRIMQVEGGSEMKLEIKLKNPKYCDGCPCCQQLRLDELEYYCSVDNVELRDASKQTGDYTGDVIRPQECITENGE